MRQRRRMLSNTQQHHAALRLFAHLRRQLLLRKGLRIALYLGNDGEIDPRYFIDRLAKAGIRIYLPVLHPIKLNTLLFAPYTPGQQLISNRFGIEEPSLKSGRWVAAQHLHLILMPLVAFDRAGNRLGMGGGYYDRALAFKRRGITRKRPRLIGLAHAFQEVAQLPSEEWDIPLDGVCTDQHCLMQ